MIQWAPSITEWIYRYGCRPAFPIAASYLQHAPSPPGTDVYPREHCSAPAQRPHGGCPSDAWASAAADGCGRLKIPGANAALRRFHLKRWIEPPASPEHFVACNLTLPWLWAIRTGTGVALACAECAERSRPVDRL